MYTYYCICLDRSENELNLPEHDINKENEAVEETVAYDKSKLDEDLISAVQKRRALYDHRIPLKERGRQKKDDLWKDVSQYLKGKIIFYYILFDHILYITI